MPHQRTRQALGRSATYADTGVPGLLAALADEGAGPSTHATLVGGATMDGGFDMGARVAHAVRELLLKNRIPIRNEDLGGSLARTVYFELATGRVEVTSPDREALWLA